MKVKINKFISEMVMVAKGGALLMLIGSVMTKFVSFFSSIFLVQVLSKDELGILTYADNWSSYVYLLAGGGLAYALLRYTVLAESIEKKKTIISFVLKTGSIVNLVLLIVVGILILLYPHPSEYAEYSWLIVALVCLMPFKFVVDSVLYIERAFDHIKTYTITAFLTSSVLIAARIVGGKIGGLVGLAIVAVLAESLAAFITFTHMYVKNLRGVNGTVIDKSEKKVIAKYSLQYMFTNSLWTIFMLNETFILGQNAGSSAELASYRIACVLPVCLSLISNAIGIYMGPKFVEAEKRDDWNWILKQWKNIHLITDVTVLFAGLAMFILAPVLIGILYGNEYMDAVSVMRMLTIGAVLNAGPRYTNANILAALGKIKFNMYVSLGAVIIQIIANIVVVSKYGAMGIATVSMLLYACMAIALSIVFYLKVYKTHQNVCGKE